SPFVCRDPRRAWRPADCTLPSPPHSSWSRPTPPAPPRPRPGRVRLGVEALEDRRVPAAIPQGAAFDVGAALPGSVGVARADSGNFAQTWKGGDGIYVKLFNGSGQPLTAAKRVPGTTGPADSAPTIAMSANGAFVVAWTHDNVTDRNVWAQRYNAAGAALGGVIGVATGPGDEGEAEAGMDAAGNFAVTYYRETGGGDVVVRQFNSS